MEQSVNAKKTINKRPSKFCFVPGCKSTTISTPNKRFLSVPKGEKRVKWLSQARREPVGISLISTMHCCEDHFNVSIRKIKL